MKEIHNPYILTIKKKRGTWQRYDKIVQHASGKKRKAENKTHPG